MDYIFLFIIMIYCFLCSVQDIRKLAVSNWLLYSGIAVVLSLRIIENWQNSPFFILSAILFFLFYLLVRRVTGNKFGMADVIFGLFQGLCVEIFLLPVCVLLEVILVFVVFNKKLKNRKMKIPFIPFMSVSLLITFGIQFCGIIKI